MPKYVILEKLVGETPLQAVEKFKLSHPEYADVPMAYAGRLDPMATGKLLVLLGDECKKQEEYHGLDKEYEFEVLLGSQSDTGDVLGLVDWKEPTSFNRKDLLRVTKSLVGPLALPYPSFSSRTVKGKPLHMWTLEGRLDEIEVPTAETIIHSLKLEEVRTQTVVETYNDALRRINLIPPVTEESKQLGRDFRRSEVRVAWQVWLEHHKDKEVQVARFKSVASSGTYMRSLSSEIGRQLGTTGLAYNIRRSKIGAYRALPFGLGWWRKKYS